MFNSLDRLDRLEAGLDLLDEAEARIEASIDRHLTPEVLDKLRAKGITEAQARVHLRRKAMGAVLQMGVLQ